MFEYKVIPAPRRGQRAKGAKGNGGRFAAAMETTLNELGADGWEYVRAETLPADERHGVMRKKVEEYHNVLVFRRAIDVAEAAEETPASKRPFFAAHVEPSAAPVLGPANAEPEDAGDTEVAADTDAAEDEETPDTSDDDDDADSANLDDEPPVTRASSA